MIMFDERQERQERQEQQARQEHDVAGTDPSTSGFRVDEREVIHETLEGEAVLVHLGTGTYFSLGGSAAEIWPLVVAGAGRDEILAEAVRRFDGERGTIEQEVGDLLGQFVDHGLAVPAAARELSEAMKHGDGPASPYVSPRLEAFEDMQELLLLDPIHETGDEGWPSKS
jgi:hypothetical protein